MVPSQRKLDPKSLYRIHRKGTSEEYREYCYYVLEAKLVLRKDILVSIMTEFVENESCEVEKQDCERNACWRLLKKLHEEFPRLPVCLRSDSLYACETFFEECRRYGYHYILRFKEGSIPCIEKKFGTLRNREGNLRKEKRFLFITNLPLTKKNVRATTETGRLRWKIENEGFNTQKNQGYWNHGSGIS